MAFLDEFEATEKKPPNNFLADFEANDKPEKSLKDSIYEVANGLFRSESVMKGLDGAQGANNSAASQSLSDALLQSKSDNRPVLQEGAKVVDGLSGIAEVGARKGYAGIGRIEAGALKALADMLGSDTLSNTAKQQQDYANQVESGAVLSGSPVEGFAKESIVQDLPNAATNAIGSVITTAPAIGAGVLSGGSALPAIFATTGATEYGQGREEGLNPVGSALRALPNAAFEVIGEKLGGLDKITDGLRTATKGNGVADLGAAMLQSAVKELPSEEFTTTGQFLTDKLPGVGLNQEAGLDEYGQQLKDTALATILQSGAMGAMGAGGSALNSIAKPNAQEAPVEQPIEQPIAQEQPAVNTDAVVNALSQAQELVAPKQDNSFMAEFEASQTPEEVVEVPPPSESEVTAELAKANLETEINPSQTEIDSPVIEAESDNIQTGDEVQDDSVIRGQVEAIVKRRAAANEIGKSKQFDSALQLAKSFMNGEKVSPTKFKNAAVAFKNDKVLFDTFTNLANQAKVPAKEARAEVTKTLDTYKQIIGSARTVEELQSIASDIQAEASLNDNQAQELDGLAMDAIDALSGYQETSFSRSAMKSVEANSERGEQSMNKVLVDKADIKRAMYHNELGWIDFVWGDDNRGIQHIIKQRTKKDGLSKDDIYKLLTKDLVETIAAGETIRNTTAGTSSRLVIKGKENEAVLVKSKGSNSWLLTGYKLNEQVIKSGGATASDLRSNDPIRSRVNEVAAQDKTNQSTFNLATRHSVPASVAKKIKDDNETVLSENDVVNQKDSSFKRDNDPLRELFSQGIEGGLTKAEAEAAIKKEINGADIDVFESMAEAPSYIQTQAYSEGAGGVEGYFDSRTNRVAIIANNITSAKRAIEVARHELIGHYGMENMLGDDLMEELIGKVLKAEKAKNSVIVDLAKQVDETQPGISQSRRAKEIIAVMAERNLQNDIVKRVLDAIRKFLHKNGLLNLDVTDVQVAKLLRDAQDYLAKQNRSYVEASDVSFSRKPVTVDTRDNFLFRRDELGRIQITATGKAYDLISEVTQNIADKFSFGMASSELRKLIRHFKADMQKAMDSAGKVAKVMAPMSEADRALVSDVVEKMVKTGVNPPEHILRIAAGMQQTMDAQTDELVKLGMLSKDSAERWRGKYLPRFYKRDQDPALDTLAKKLLRTALPIRGMGGGSLKGRGLYQEIDVNELVQWEALGWEVRDNLWKKNRQGKLELIDDSKIRDTEKVMVWRDFTPAERETMNENRDALFRYVMGYTAMQNDIALGRMFDGIAKNQEWTRSRPSEGFSKVPDSDIADTGGVKKYGNLAGLYVRDDIIQHITQYEESGELLKFYRKALSFWKMGKTVLNPVSHMNNVVSNLSMAHFAGVSYWDTHKYVGALRDFVNNAPMIQEAKDVGLMTGDITRAELIAEMPADIKAMLNQQDSKIKKSVRLTYNILTFGLTRPMSNAYKFEDDFFKYLIYKDARANGVSPDDAVNYATRYIFNYDDLPKGARAVRDSLIPFFAYTYKAVPALTHTAFNYPWRFAAPAVAIYGLNALSYGLIAGDEDDDLAEKYAKGKALEAEERKNLPPWMQGKSSLGTEKTIRLGTDEKTDLPIYMDISRMIPGGDVFDLTNQAAGMPLPAPIMPSNPILTSIAAILWNKDTFTGKELTDINDTKKEASQKRAEWLLKQISPAIAPTGYHADRLMQAGAQMADTTIETPFKDYTGFGKDGLPVQPKYAAANTIGIKARPIDLELSADISGGQDRKELSSINSEYASLTRLVRKNAISERQYETEIKKLKEKRDYIRSK